MLTTGKFRFGEFELDRDRRQLLRAGEPTNLYPKAFDLLEHLVANHGRTLSKDELLEHVWPGQFVEENNLTVQISALRKVFGDTGNPKRFISTVPGKGYRFVANVIEESDESEIVIEQRSISRIVVESDDLWPVEATGIAPIQNSGSLNAKVSRSYGRTASMAVLTGLLVFIAVAFAYRGSFFAGGSVAVPFLNSSVRQLTTNGKVGSAALSPDGRTFVYTVNDLGSQSLWLGYIDGSGEHLQLIPGSDTNFRNLAFSPDALTVYFSARNEKNPNGTIFRMPATGGLQTRLIEGVRDFSLSHDGSDLVYSKFEPENSETAFFATNIATLGSRKLGRLTSEYSQYPSSLAISPDGSRIAVGMARQGSKAYDLVGILDLASGKVNEITSPKVREVTRAKWMADGNSLIVTAVEKNDFSSAPHYRLWHADLQTNELTMLTADRSSYGESWLSETGVSFDLSQANDLLLGIEHRQASNIWIAPLVSG